MKILCFGSLNNDHTFRVEHLVTPGETLTAKQVTTQPGGKGLNQSLALAKAGAAVSHAGMVGEDGRHLLALCEQSGVDAHLIRVLGDGALTGQAIIQVSDAGQNCIVLAPGANRMITQEYIDDVFDSFEQGDFILLQNEISCMPEIIDRAYEKGLVIALNPSPFDEMMKQCDLSKVSWFIMNEIEGGQITGKTKADDILTAMRELYPKAKVVLTLGGDGSLYADGEQVLKQGIYKVKALDTTAAGDTFTGFFLAKILEGGTPAEALDLAAKASAIAVTRLGASTSIPTRAEAEAFDGKLA